MRKQVLCMKKKLSMSNIQFFAQALQWKETSACRVLSLACRQWMSLTTRCPRLAVTFLHATGNWRASQLLSWLLFKIQSSIFWLVYFFYTCIWEFRKRLSWYKLPQVTLSIFVGSVFILEIKENPNFLPPSLGIRAIRLNIRRENWPEIWKSPPKLSLFENT